MLDNPLSPGPAGTMPDGSRYHSRIQRMGAWRLRVFSTGRAGTSATARLHQDALFRPYLVQLPAAGLMAWGGVVLTSGWVIADAGGLRIWSGGPLSWAGGRTSLADCRERGLCGNDRRLARLDEPAWQRQFLALPPSLLARAARAPRPGDRALYYVDGGEAGTVALEHLRLGTPSTPVLLMVDGDLGSLRHSRIHGLVYVAGNCSAVAEGLVLEGALVSGGMLRLTGNYRIRHRSDILRRLQRLAGRFVPVPGTWRDGGA